MNDFTSDNSAGLCPEALEAIARVSGGFAASYGGDVETATALRRVRGLFGPDVEVAFVATGTAANTLAIASLTHRWQRILCEEHAHLAVDESTGPELVTGCRVSTIDADGHKLTPGALEERDRGFERAVHHPAPGVLTISNPTEFGEVYTPEETAALAATSHRLGYRFHVDGARFANAVASLGCEPRELTADAGVDALSFGGTKNGLALGDAIVLFPGEAGAEAARRLPMLCKAGGHLLSKQRFVTGPFAAVLEDDAWLRHAAHANHMARRLSEGLAAAGFPPRFPTESNGVFVPLPDEVQTSLTQSGWTVNGFGHPDWHMARFMTSFATDPARVDQLLHDATVAYRA